MQLTLDSSFKVVLCAIQKTANNSKIYYNHDILKECINRLKDEPKLFVMNAVYLSIINPLQNDLKIHELY